MPNYERIGIVGLGGIGTLHGETVEELGHRVAGGADPDESARLRFEDEFDAPAYESHRALLETETVDALVVTTPNAFHREPAIDALESNTHVLVEKPLADTLPNAREIASTAAQSDAFCMVGFHNRFSAPVRILTDHIENGSLGEIKHVEANYMRRRGIPGRGSWFTNRSIAGGGALTDLGVHVVDLALNFLGSPRDLTILGTTRTNFGNKGDSYPYLHMWGEDDPSGSFDVDDSTSAFIRTDSGPTISLEVAWATNRPPTHELYVRGTEGGASLDIEEGTLTLYDTEDQPTDHHLNTTVEVGEDDAYRNQQEHFLESVATDTPPTQNTVDEALLVQQVVDGIYRSNERGDAVSIETLHGQLEKAQ